MTASEQQYTLYEVIAALDQSINPDVDPATVGVRSQVLVDFILEVGDREPTTQEWDDYILRRASATAEGGQNA